MKRYFIHTFGCQMNVADSQRMSELLGTLDYRLTPTSDQADLIVLNTCSIREKSEEKMLSALGRYRQVKAQRGALIAVAGCVAQQEKERILKKAPFVDMVLGPDQIGKLPEMIGKVQARAGSVVETAFVDSENYVFPTAQPGSSLGRVTEFVTIMKGCDNVCSFCVVPHTRGREVSRPHEEVLKEVEQMAAVGVREVTLVGQNVNSYRGGQSFAQLLKRVARVQNIARVRFTTSHPHDLSDELIAAFAEEPKIASHFHLPVQCGSDAVLKRMRRDYTVEAYLERLAKLRRARPDIAVTTDMIVGFPGETEEDFEKTLRLTELVRYDAQFSFVFSARPKTGAALRESEWGPIPHEEKIRRLETLQALQKRITSEIHAAYKGQVVEVLVEGAGKLDPSTRFGRTSQNRAVVFSGDGPKGALVKVLVERPSLTQLVGRSVEIVAPSLVPIAETSQGPLDAHVV